MLMETGKVKLISEEGIEWIKNHIKKEGVLVSNSGANGDQHLESQLLGVTLLTIHFTGRVRGKLVV
nr:ORF00006-like [Lacticaseibacillus paracasei subsp. paracasei]